MNHITDENESRCVKLRGMPFRTSYQEVIDFFEGYGLTYDDIIFEQRKGSRTGWALVILPSKAHVIKAHQELHQKYIGNRFVDVIVKF